VLTIVYLREFLNDNMYKNNPQTLAELNIHLKSDTTLHHVASNIQRKVNACTRNIMVIFNICSNCNFL